MKLQKIDLFHIAYARTQDEEGYINIEWGQGETLIFLTKDIQDATLFGSVDEIYSTLTDAGFEYISIEFFIKKRIINIEYYKKEHSNSHELKCEDRR